MPLDLVRGLKYKGLNLVGYDFNLPVVITAQDTKDLRDIYKAYAYFEGVLLGLSEGVDALADSYFLLHEQMLDPQEFEVNIGRYNLIAEQEAVDETLTILEDEIDNATHELGRGYSYDIINLDPRLEKVYNTLSEEDDISSLANKLDKMAQVAKTIGDEIMLIIKDDANRRPHIN